MTQFIDLPNSRIAYRRVGHGPDVVFVHGWPVDSTTYRHVIPALSKQFTCHLFDLPGAGDTIWNKQTPISLAGHCQTLQQVVDHLDLSQFALVAHDSGGVFARHLAAHRPEQVRGMVLSNTDIPGVHLDAVKHLINATRLPGSSRLISTLLRSRAFRKSKFCGRALFYNLDKFEAEFSDRYIHPLYRNQAALAGQLQLIRNWDWAFLDSLTQLHRQISCPVQLIWGRNDIVFRLKDAQNMVKEFGGRTELKVIERSRLYVQEEQPEQFIEHALPHLHGCF